MVQQNFSLLARHDGSIQMQNQKYRIRYEASIANGFRLRGAIECNTDFRLRNSACSTVNISMKLLRVERKICSQAGRKARSWTFAIVARRVEYSGKITRSIPGRPTFMPTTMSAILRALSSTCAGA